ncbi:hypothetical protein L7F22_023903 [Adiantum nelumboides]|nr:hypothetical protein [Adiantum nelumboides]
MLNSPSKVFDSVIIIDRSIDLATPLCTQLTYEGLVDEVVGIQSAHVEVDASLVADAQQTTGGLTKAHTSLRLHTGLTEKIMEYTTKELFNFNLELQQNIIAGLDLNGQLNSIEELILAEAPLFVVLRLLCLLSVVGGGIKPKNLEYLKREILQTYGYDKLGLLNMLNKTQLLTRATTTSSRSSVGFQAVRSPLRLVVDDVDERDPNDVSYVYSGYAPLSVRLVQAIAQKDALLARQSPSSTRKATTQGASDCRWRGFEDVVRCLNGPAFEQVQTRHEAGEAGSSITRSPAALMDSTTAPTTHTLVFFLGA